MTTTTPQPAQLVPDQPPLGNTKTAEQRFWERVKRGGPDDCWEWTGSLDKNGYGQFRNGNASRQAHRYSYELHVGPLGDLLACHSCDNRKCVNPAHIFPGTQRDNIRDMVAKGRRYRPDVVGEKNASAKLTVALVREARQKFADGVSISQLSREYRVSWTGMKKAVIRETWRHA